MKDAWTGGCSCGAIRYSIVGAPMVMNVCHCRQCQRDSGTGHGCHVTFSGAAVTVTGEPAGWDSVGENGTRKRRGFCTTCGAPVTLGFPDMPDLFVVSAASLDDPDRFDPQCAMWTSAAPPWDAPAPGMPSFAKMPPQG